MRTPSNVSEKNIEEEAKRGSRVKGTVYDAGPGAYPAPATLAAAELRRALKFLPADGCECAKRNEG